MEGSLSGKCGLEIGGPSPIFSKNRLIPVYDRCQKIDSCNFSQQTIWAENGDNRKFGPSAGSRFVAEACELSMIPDAKYDFVLASHVLEHLANPLKALTEWKRVLVPGGILILIVPDKRGTFDHRRPYTTFAHIQSDFENGTAEDDSTHVEEITRLHDLGSDPSAGSPEDFRERCLRNFSFRAMHHHVFHPDTIVRMFTHAGMRMVNLAIELPFHMIAAAQKPVSAGMEAVRMENAAFLSEGAEWREYDPLATLHDSNPADS
jgi:ubiquinone/menaquinone biosynthesis C-methylase UbiE